MTGIEQTGEGLRYNATQQAQIAKAAEMFRIARAIDPQLKTFAAFAAAVRDGHGLVKFNLDNEDDGE